MDIGVGLDRGNRQDDEKWQQTVALKAILLAYMAYDGNFAHGSEQSLLGNLL